MTLPLNTAPGPSPSDETSRELLRQAREEFGKGNLRQAAERSWYAAANIVKALGKKRGWDANADWQMRRVIFDIMDESDDKTLLGCYVTAQHAHYYFCSERYEALGVRYAIDGAAALVDKLDQILAEDVTLDGSGHSIPGSSP